MLAREREWVYSCVTGTFLYSIPLTFITPMSKGFVVFSILMDLFLPGPGGREEGGGLCVLQYVSDSKAAVYILPVSPFTQYSSTRSY